MTVADRVLLVDDSRAILQFLAAQIKARTLAEVDTAASLAEARHCMEAQPERYFVAVLDLNLPDAPAGEVVDLARSYGLPSIVLTGHLSDDLRDAILDKQVIDYIIKANAGEIGHAADLVHRIRCNQDHRVLVVDDSRAFRRYLVQLLSIHRFQTVEACNGKEALGLLEEHPDISLVLTDDHMPEMDGRELVTEIRRTRSRNELAVIGISDQASPLMSARFLKTGANDFLAKPFVVEEFYCRVTQNIETIEHIRLIRDNSIRDYLTKVYNRAYLFEVGERFHDNARRGNLTLTTAMVDIDFFKRVNDTYGHLVGDLVLKNVAATLADGLRKGDVIGRYGGEEFCVLLANAKPADVEVILERMRVAVETLEIPHGDTRLRVTVSIGAALETGQSFKTMLAGADECLYQAKASGRNRVVMATSG